ncbi:MAG: tyrosine-protein phosphatase [Dehalococcoidia bacterium]|nr:tyrosine-protein phosphatase [Dehalococcoidia bacterium]
MPQGFDRFIPLQGCVNFRDLGGYPTRDGRTVKWRRLFRSDAMHPMTQEDAAYVSDTLGVVTVVDLRNSNEVKRDGRGAIVRPSVRFHSAPFLEHRGILPYDPTVAPADRLADIYQWILRNAGGAIAGALGKLAADGGLPAVFHCTAGKDRTGVLAALTLGILGVDNEEIMRDFTLTNQILDQLFERLRAIPGSEGRPRESFAAPPEAMEQFLAELSGSYGDATSYVRAYGATESTIAGLRASLLE